MDTLPGVEQLALGTGGRRRADDRRRCRGRPAGLSFRPAARLSDRAAHSLQRTMELVTLMDLIREYWWIAAIVVALVVAVPAASSAPAGEADRKRAGTGPHGLCQAARGARPRRRSCRGRQRCRRRHHPRTGSRRPGRRCAGDDLCLIKGIGPKFAIALHELGFHRFEQIAGLTRDRDRAARSAARRLCRPHRARPDRRAGRLSRPQRYRRVRTEVREALADRLGLCRGRLAPRA